MLSILELCEKHAVDDFHFCLLIELMTERYGCSPKRTLMLEPDFCRLTDEHKRFWAFKGTGPIAEMPEFQRLSDFAKTHVLARFGSFEVSKTVRTTPEILAEVIAEWLSEQQERRRKLE